MTAVAIVVLEGPFSQPHSSFFEDESKMTEEGAANRRIFLLIFLSWMLSMPSFDVGL